VVPRISELGYNLVMSIRALDEKIIFFFKTISIPVARIALFIVFFWFGFLKIVGLSPASGVVESLFETTISFISFATFIIFFGLFECIIGTLFLLRGAERLVIPLLFIHMITTFGPLVLLPVLTWQSLLVPTLEGQYIIKNLVIIALAIGIASHLRPMTLKG
jgi:uncharacterized membrane protein YkgB